MTSASYREQFWTNVERAFADYDNAHFDIARKREADRRKDRRDSVLLACGLLTTLVVVFSVYFIWLFGLMPLPQYLQ